MISSFLNKISSFFHSGKMPDEVMVKLESEGGILYKEEGIRETAIFQNFRSPGIYCGWRKIGFIGYFILSERRIIVQARCYDYININALYDAGAFQKIEFSVGPKYLSISFNAADHLPKSSGQVEIRLHLSDISAAVDILRQKGANIAVKTAGI
jgi:hypothetical protein